MARGLDKVNIRQKKWIGDARSVRGKIQEALKQSKSLTMNGQLLQKGNDYGK